MRKIVCFVLLGLLFLSAIPVFAQENDDEVNIYLFWTDGCPHCSAEKAFLEKLAQKYPGLNVHLLEISDRKNAELLGRIAKEFGVEVSGVPFTVVGEQYFIGWLSEETTGKAVEDAVLCVIANHCPDKVSGLVTQITPEEQPLKKKAIPEKLSFPLIGEIETKNLSLPVLTLLIAFLDGFNPCAMWVLLFLVSLLFGMHEKRKMWLFGSIFLAVSALVYFMFMAAWLNLFIFLGFVFWVRLGIGGVALYSGYSNLKEYITNPYGGCKVVGEKKRQKVFESLKRIIQEKKLIFAIVGLVLLAFAVNLVELVCSLGLPAVYTQILSLSNLSTWQYYAYLVFYVLVFILPAFVVFFIAATTLHITAISTKYGRLCHLVGGIIMLVIGLLMIFKPEWLMFG
ncbi:MAG: hypothetical protein QXT19_02505 [Candidatus Woesearchaeota archaeon]